MPHGDFRALQACFLRVLNSITFYKTALTVSVQTHSEYACLDLRGFLYRNPMSHQMCCETWVFRADGSWSWKKRIY